MTPAANVLIAGAGPAGLALALQAHDHGANVRIVDRRPEAFRPSRALIVHARTLEALRPLGVTDALLAHADIAPEVCMHMGSREVRQSLADVVLANTAFPHLSLLRQMDVEAVLTRALVERGVQVSRGVELVEAWDGADDVRVVLRSRDGVERMDYDFVVGCDGPTSTVRAFAGMGWHGGPYGEEVVLADVELSGGLARDVAHVFVGSGGLLLVFALGERAAWRVLATRPAGSDPPEFGRPGPPIPLPELQAILKDAGLNAQVTNLAWSARYRLQHRIAGRFRAGRLFVAGDAAHAFSPAGGQGMNTGIQDAVNLGWKLAFAPSATDPMLLLASYDLERRRVARQMLALTHLGFWVEASTRPLPAMLRGILAPLAAPAIPVLPGRLQLVTAAIRLLSQLWVAYPDSPLSVEGTPRLASGPRAGKRLPDTTVNRDGEPVQLHRLLARPGVHVLLQRDASRIEDEELGSRATVHRLTSMPGEGLIAIRPDGYVGFRCRTVDMPQLRAWLGLIGAVGPSNSRVGSESRSAAHS